MDYWQIQDIFHKRMKQDYESGLITNPVFKPYFQWKFYGAPVETLTKQVCYQIMKEAQKELDKLDDCYLYSYLIGVEAEITNILVMKWG